MTEALCKCGKPASHLNADPDSQEWTCRMPQPTRPTPAELDDITASFMASMDRIDAERNKITHQEDSMTIEQNDQATVIRVGDAGSVTVSLHNDPYIPIEIDANGESAGYALTPAQAAELIAALSQALAQLA